MGIDEEIEKLIKRGSSISGNDLINIKEDVLLCIRKNDINESLNDILCELEEATYEYMLSNTINGISTTIYLANSFDYYINISSGKSIHGKDITYDTLFDIASVTKLFTLFLIFKYEELGIINLDDRICDLDSRFKYLDYKVEDIIKMSGSIITNGRIDQASSKEEAINLLRTIHPVDYNLDVNHYTDIGFMVLSEIIEKINNESYEKVLKKFLNKFGIEINNSTKIAGNGNLDMFVHDPKARKMEKVIGSSGIFIDSLNMSKFAKNIFINNDLISKINLEKLQKKMFNLYHDNRGYAGINLKHPLGIKKSATPNEYSNCSFSHQGFTGSSAIFDPINRIHNSIFVDAIDINTNKKHPEFFKYYNTYHQKLVISTLKVYLIKKYYEKFEQKNINIIKNI